MDKTGNWATNALGDIGDLGGARKRHKESAEAEKQAGWPIVHVIDSELEALRLDIIEGRATEALPGIEEWLTRLVVWWQQHRAGQEVAEVPDSEYLARAYIGALDIACEADSACKDWPSALQRLDTMLVVERALQRPAAEIGGTRLNMANVLTRLDQLPEARTELEACRELFSHYPTMLAKVLGSLARPPPWNGGPWLSAISCPILPVGPSPTTIWPPTCNRTTARPPRPKPTSIGWPVCCIAWPPDSASICRTCCATMPSCPTRPRPQARC